MRAQARTTSRSRRPVFDEAYFERKAAELVAPEEEIEAWELDARELDGLAEDYFNTPGSE